MNPYRLMLLAALVALSTFILHLSSLADVPHLINYQGRLRDNATGLPLNGMVNIQVNLFTNETGGVPALPAQDIGLVPVTNGVYSFHFGSAALPGLLSHPEVWLQATVDGNILAPRQRLIAVPYAVMAGAVQGPNLFVSPSGRVGVGSSSPSSTLTVSSPSNLATQDPSSYAMQILQGDGQTAVGSDQANSYIQSFRLKPMHLNPEGNNILLCGKGAGNIGIGTATPRGKQEIYSDSPSTNPNLVLGSGQDRNPKIHFRGPWSVQNPEVPYGEIKAWNDHGGPGDLASASLRFYTASGDPAVLTEKLVIQGNGNLGIGILSPTNKLHVLGGATFSSGSGGANQNVVWTPGSASWSFTSDRQAKERITPVDTESVLDRLIRLPIAEWNFIGHEQRHVGPMAQDFHAQFPLNDDDKALSDADLHGVALAAIQGLNAKLEAELRRRDAENAELKKQFAETVPQLLETLRRQQQDIEKLKSRLQFGIR